MTNVLWLNPTSELGSTLSSTEKEKFIYHASNNFMNSLGVGWAGGLVGVPEFFKKKSFITQNLMQCLASAEQN